MIVILAIVLAGLIIELPYIAGQNFGFWERLAWLSFLIASYAVARFIGKEKSQ